MRSSATRLERGAEGSTGPRDGYSRSTTEEVRGMSGSDELERMFAQYVLEARPRPGAGP